MHLAAYIELFSLAAVEETSMSVVHKGSRARSFVHISLSGFRNSVVTRRAACASAGRSRGKGEEKGGVLMHSNGVRGCEF